MFSPPGQVTPICRSSSMWTESSVPNPQSTTRRTCSSFSSASRPVDCRHGPRAGFCRRSGDRHNRCGHPQCYSRHAGILAADGPRHRSADGRVSPSRGGYMFGNSMWTIIQFNNILQESRRDVWPRIEHDRGLPGRAAGGCGSGARGQIEDSFSILPAGPQFRRIDRCAASRARCRTGCASPRDRRAGGVELAQHLHDGVAAGGVEVAGRLVGQNDGRLARDRACYGDKLLVPARQRRRPLLRVAHADPPERGHRPLPGGRVRECRGASADTRRFRTP